MTAVAALSGHPSETMNCRFDGETGKSLRIDCRFELGEWRIDDKPDANAPTARASRHDPAWRSIAPAGGTIEIALELRGEPEVPFSASAKQASLPSVIS